MSEAIEDGQVVTLLSPERLASCLAIAGTEGDAIKLHHQCLRLAGAIMPIIALSEIALRNAICELLREKLGVANWLTTPPANFKWKQSEVAKIADAVRQARRAIYAKKTNAEKKALDQVAYPKGVPANIGHARRSKARQAAIQINIGQTVAQLTMFFWKRLFSDDYEETLWKPILKTLFPNKKLPRSQISSHLEVIYEARNRIAHHESIMGDRLARLVEALDFLALNFGVKTPSEDAVLARMMTPFRQALEQEIAAMNALIASFVVSKSLPTEIH
jgi:hypothetical protein